MESVGEEVVELIESGQREQKDDETSDSVALKKEKRWMVSGIPLLLFHL